MPLDPPAILTGQQNPAPVDGRVIHLRAEPSSVAAGRRFAADVVTDLPRAAKVPDEHVWAVNQCASELLTNAITAADRFAEAMRWGWSYLDTPVHINVRATERWTRIAVRDPEPFMRTPEPRDELDEHGRGLAIIAMLAQEFGHVPAPGGKLMYAVIGVGSLLTAEELATAIPRRPA